MSICKEYQLILNEAQSKKKQIKKFFQWLKRSKDGKKINALFHQYHDKVFEEIDCLKCANCCSGVGPMITDKDITRMAGALKTKPSEVVTRYLKIDEDNDYIFKEKPCPFLNNQNHLCSIYDSRPKACREYPHTDHHNIQKILPITQKNCFVCPAVYKIVQKVAAEVE